MSYQTKQRLDYPRVSFGSDNQNLGSKEAILTEKIPFKENIQPQCRQFQELKELLKEKKYLEERQVMKAEKERRDLLEDNLRLQSKFEMANEAIKQRDHLINNLERHMEDNQKQLELDQQMFLTAKQKENMFENTQDELKEMVAQLNQQLRLTNDEAGIIKQRARMLEQEHEVLKQNELQNLKHYEKREDEFMQLIHQEQDRNRQLYQELDYYNKENKDKDQIITQLEENVRTLNKVVDDQCRRIDEEKQKAKEIVEQFQGKSKKTDEIIKEFTSLETRHAKIKSKLETENIHLKEDKERYLLKYKEKLTKYKTALRSVERENNELKMDKLRLATENDQLHSISKQLEHQLGSMHTDVPLMERQNTSMNSEIEKLKMINTQLNEALKQADYDMNHINQQLQSAVQRIEMTNQQYESLMEENQLLQRALEEKKNEVKQAELMIEKMCELSNQQMDELDSKFHKVTASAHALQHEKQALWTECNNMKVNLEQMEGNEAILEKRVVKLRRENKELSRQLKELNQNMREMIVEKHSELKVNNSLHQSRFSNAKMMSNNQSYRSLRGNNILMSGTKDLSDDYDDENDL